LFINYYEKKKYDAINMLYMQFVFFIKIKGKQVFKGLHLVNAIKIDNKTTTLNKDQLNDDKVIILSDD
jgi:hypothetical protein